MAVKQHHSMERLDLSNNMLTGPIPKGLSRLKRLTVLNLMSNNLSGDIPKGIGDLPRLNTLVYGTIPSQEAFLSSWGEILG
jgi:Leucine-rich repeat (LRR) protein